MLISRIFQNHKKIAFSLFATFLLTACAQSTPLPVPQTAIPQIFTATVPSTAVAQAVEGSPTATAAVELPLETPTLISPAADRQKPEDWQNWPVIPVVSERARQIYEAGLAAGNDPARFSKVGDCQAIKNVLLGMYDKPGGYTLRENKDALSETITHFTGSFDRDGEAVQGGFNAASELTPLMSNPDVCEPGETPLECEVRVHNPSILLISLEVWWNGRSPNVYEKNMRQIIEYSLSKGILPILSTKADNVEGDQSINLATARLAYEYDLPLWNWWKAAQSLPNHGLDPDRPDGFHISQQFAWPERSFTALQALDAVWRAVQPKQMPVITATQVPVQEDFNLLAPTATRQTASSQPTAGCTTQTGTEGVCSIPGLEKTPTVIPAALGASATHLQAIDPQLQASPAGFILLSTARRSGETVTALGIQIIDPASGASVQLAPEGTSLQAVSPDGKKILFSRGKDLLLAGLDGSEPVVLTNRFFDRGASSAVWLPDGKNVAFLADQNGSSLLVLYPLDGTSGWKRLSPAGMQPVVIYPSKDPGHIFWENGTCPASGACTSTGLYISGLDGSSAEYLPGAVKAAISSDGHWLAFEQKDKADNSLLTLASMDLSVKRPQENIGSQLLDFSWSPDGTRLSLLTLDRSDYSGQWLDVRNLIISSLDMGTKILPPTAGMNPRAVWSADNASLLLTGTQQTDNGYSIHMTVMDVTSGAVRELPAPAGFTDKGFIYTTRVNWVKSVP